MNMPNWLFGALWIVGCGWFLIRYYNFDTKARFKLLVDKFFTWGDNRPGVVGHYISAKQILRVWPTISGILGFTAVGIPYFLISAIFAIWLGFGFMGSVWYWGIYLLLAVGVSVYIGWPTKATALRVPNNTVAPLLILGELRRIYLEEGEYPWWPQALNSRLFLRFNVFDRARIARRDFTTRIKDGDPEDGFVKIGTASGSQVRIPFTLYNSAKDVGSDQNVMIKGGAKTGAPVKTELLITLEITDPYPLLRNQDPGLEIAERGRSALRTGQAQLTSLDNLVAKDSLAHLAEGRTILFAFMSEAIGTLQAGSIVRDLGGEPIYRIVIPQGDELPEATDSSEVRRAKKQRALERTKAEYKAHLDQFISTEMRRTITSQKSKKRGADGNLHWQYVIEERSIKADLTKVIEVNGAKLVSASVGTVITDERLADAAVQAEQQSFEGATAVASAKATALAMTKMTSTEEQMRDPAYHDKLGIAAAADPGGRAQFNRVSGEPLLAAAALLKQGGTAPTNKDS